MLAIIAGILAQFWPYILAALGALGWGLAQRRAGAKAEKARQAEREAKARDIADEIDGDIGALPPKDAREELGKWSR